MNKQLRGSILLLLAAAIWGAAFVAQSEGMNYVGPYTMQTIRFLLAGLVLLPVIAFCDRKYPSPNRPTTQQEKLQQFLSGFTCGVILFLASSFQQNGLLYTTVGKSGFVTALYIIFVPILGIFMKRKIPPRIWFCAALGLVGLYFLCVRGSLNLNKGDLLTFVCAILYAIHICYIDSVTPKVDCIRLSCTQFFVCAAFSAVGMFARESPTVSAIFSCWLPIVYAGVFSGGVAFTFQIIGQRDVHPSLASLEMSLESVFSALFGWLLIGQKLSPTELLGCGIMFTAIILAQLPGKTKASQS